MTKIAGSGSISQRHGSADPDPDPPQNGMDPEHCIELNSCLSDADHILAGEQVGPHLRLGTENKLDHMRNGKT
jgi:hypothetical protein